MKLHEYQAKNIFSEFNIPVQAQQLVQTTEAACQAAVQIGCPVVVKAQVLVGGRGKAGGVKLAETPEEARKKAQNILGLDIKGITVQQLLITQAAQIEKEYYAGLVLDRSGKQIVLMLTSEGGIDIEELAQNDPGKIFKLAIDPADGLQDKDLEPILTAVFPQQLIQQGNNIIKKLYNIFTEKDCSLLEINPLALTDNQLLALDAKMVVDDNALFRHPELLSYRNEEEYSKDEEEARESGLSFVEMDGNIGCIVNGAGLAMATMDIIKLKGGVPANFLDVGGSSNPQKVVHAMQIILRNKNVRAILINIFGGITRCDDIAKGLIIATEQMDISVPFVVRLIGTNQKEGIELLEKKGIQVSSNLDDAVKKVISLGARS